MTFDEIKAAMMSLDEQGKKRVVCEFAAGNECWSGLMVEGLAA